MGELKDYSGPFNHHIKYEDFSKDALIKLLIEYSRTHIITMGGWHDFIRWKYNDREAIDLDITQWLATAPLVTRFISRALDIQGNDVETWFKRLQMDPGLSLGIFDIEWDLKNPDHGIFTVNRCNTLEYLEREGKGYEVFLCQEEEPRNFADAARSFNSDMKVTALKLPPRKSNDQIACQWEFKLETVI
ncbi:DUF6125 family protein [Chloroflexota bacterium]